ncbi:MAG: DUF1566 domain-containing protein, partial [Actinobacteria bacterium]|nr:DUF1566 domain-containing protein [Actinomycetota bacterium]
MKRLGPLLVAVVALTSLGAEASIFEDLVAANGRFEILAPYFYVHDWRQPSLDGPPFPVDAFLRERAEHELGYFRVAQPPWEPAIDAGWVYANETGRVRVIADTTNFHTPAGFEVNGQGYERSISTVLHLSKTYIKEPGATATFTVNSSNLAVFHPDWYNGLPGDIPRTPNYLPHVKLSLLIMLYRPQLPPNVPGKSRDEFWAEIELVRDYDVFTECPSDTCLPRDDHAYGCVNEIRDPPHDIWRCEQGLDRGSWFSVRDSPLYAYPVDFGPSYVLIETRPYTGTIDLSEILDEERYVIEYVLVAEAASYGTIENWTRAQLGDPLDPESGLGLEVSSPPAPAGKASRLCDVEPDPARFVDLGDGTVMDRSTGLMWQRCPAGFTLDAAATPGDLGDDRCVGSGSVTPIWQEALLLAVADATAGHSDWRLPNAKELDSIVELGCHMPAIEPDPFPDTPSKPFWTSTPARTATAAMAVSFASGAIAPEEKSSAAYVRLVRDALPPVASLPGVRIGRPTPLPENDAGTASIVFHVVLDRAAASEVTVHYRTVDDDAHAGEDYLATSGTLVIPVGSRVAQVAVPVLGDAIGEDPETFYLVLDRESANARLAVGVSIGTILDSQPRIDVMEANVSEGDSGNT